jgi:hypothetical protein
MDWRVQSSSQTPIDTKTNFSGQTSHAKTNFKLTVITEFAKRMAGPGHEEFRSLSFNSRFKSNPRYCIHNVGYKLQDTFIQQLGAH